MRLLPKPGRQRYFFYTKSLCTGQPILLSYCTTHSIKGRGPTSGYLELRNSLLNKDIQPIDCYPPSRIHRVRLPDGTSHNGFIC